MELILWQNLIFFIPLVTGALYALALAVSGVGDTDAGELEGDGEVEAGPGLWSGMLDFLGVGRVPLSILLTGLLLVWGASGLICNLFVGVHRVWISLLCATVMSVFGARVIGQGVARVVPSEESYHATRAELWGETGLALYSVHGQGGTVRVRDRFGHLLDLECRTFPGEESIPAGSQVRLEEYDPERDVYLVRRVGLTDEG
ncbi:MAG: DUF1449 family protein [Chloroherpetonaceae bacterium]|nr:YqiJ family protein [Chthonomonadaceae bacterium]MDW8206258.1 DUF1449 family protein [Chloroherpetonaceae bacterium]